MSRALSPAQIVASDLCIGCGVCASGGEAGMAWDAYGQLKPHGPATRRQTEAFAALCPFSPFAANEDQIAAARSPTRRSTTRALAATPRVTSARWPSRPSANAAAPAAWSVGSPPN